jgi:hypothetical protein
MPVKKETSFVNEFTFNSWKSVQGPRIQIIKHSPIIEEWAYPTSVRLSRPRIYVEYLDFSVEPATDLLDFTLHFEGVILEFDGGYLVYNG